MARIDFTSWVWRYTNDTGAALVLSDGTTIAPGEQLEFRGAAADSGAGAEQFLDSYNAFRAKLPPGTFTSSDPGMDAALRDAHEQAKAYRYKRKLLQVDVDTPAGFDPASKDGPLDRLQEQPADLVDRPVPPPNTSAEVNRQIELPNPELPPQAPPAGEEEVRSADEEDNKTSGADPVDLFTGEFFLEKIDFELPSVGFPFAFARSYKSGRSFFGPFGYNWDHNYNVYLRELANGMLAVNTGRLQEHLYTDSGDSVLFHAPRGVFARLERQPATSAFAFVQTFRGGMRYRFARPAGWTHPERIPLVSIEDTNGNVQQLVYDGNDRLAQVIDTAGRKIDLIYGSCGLLEGLRPAFLQTAGAPPVEIKYLHANDIEHLSAVVSLPTPDFPTGLITCYDYDEQQPLGEQRSNITRVIDAAGRVIVENQYGTDAGDVSFNRVVKQYFMGAEYLFNYTNIRFVPPLDQHVNDAALQVELYEPERPLKLHTFNFRGNLLDERYRLCADGSFRVWAQAYRYNRHGQLTELYHANGMAEIRTYDETNPDPLARGNLLRVELKSQPNNLLTRKIREFTYEPLFQKIKTIKDEAGAVTTFVYDYEDDPLVRRGNLARIIHPDTTLPDGALQANSVTTLRHDGRGQLIEQTSPEGRKTLFEYDAASNGAGLVRRLRDGTGATIAAFEYDTLGKLARRIDGRGNDTLFRYNLLGQLIEFQSAAINGRRAAFKFSYNADRKLAKAFSPRGEFDDGVIRGNWIVHQYDYDLQSKLVKETANSNTAAPLVTRYTRDVHGRIVAMSNPLNQTTRFRYDERSRVLRKTQFADQQFPLVQTYSYDRVGNPLRATMPDGSRYQFDHNENFTRLKSRTNPLGVREEFTYGPRDLITRAVIADANGNVLHTQLYGYDEKGRLVTHELNGLKQVFFHDRDDLVTRTLDHLGEAVTYSHDDRQRVASVVDPLGTTATRRFDANDNQQGGAIEFLSAQSGAPLRFEEQVTFDERNRPAAFVDKFGNTLSQVFDDRDLRTEVIDSTGQRVKTTYDVHGFPVRTALAGAAGDTVIQRWHRDALSRVTRFEDAEGNITRYTYDDRDNLVTVTFPDGSELQKTYDPLNRLASEKDANGSVVTFGYNPFGQVSGLQIQPGPGVAATANVNHTFDAFGRLIKVEQGPHAVERSFDFLNRVTEEKQGALAIRRVYDDAGNSVRLIYSDGREDLYRLDRVGRLKEVAFVRQGSGNALQNRFPVGTKLVEYEYDGILLAAKKLANGTVTTYGYDKDGKLSRCDLTGPAGNLIDREQHLYDGERRKRLSVRDGGVRLGKVFAYDALSRLTDVSVDTAVTAIPSNLGSQAAIDAFLGTLNPNSAPVQEHFSLTANDRRQAWQTANVSFTPTYNNLLQITRVQGSDGSAIALKYDSNGNRIEDGAFAYAYDAFDHLVKVTDKASGQPVLELTYDAAGRVVERRDGAAAATRFVFDGPRAVEEISGPARRQSVFGSGIDDLVLESGASGDRFCHLNDIGSLHAVTDSQGALSQYLDYGAFGQPAAFDGSGTSLPLTSAGTRPIFGGRPFIASTGHYEFRKRIYDPFTASFLQRDAYNYADSANPYLYCRHNPVGLTDPNGRIAPIIVGIAAAAALGAGSGAIFGSVRQGVQIATGYTDEYGNVKDEFDWNEFGVNVGFGGVAGIGIFVFPPLAGIMIAAGVVGGLSEIASGNTIVGAFDIATSVFGTKGIKQLNQMSLVSRFNRLGLDTMISIQGARLRSNRALATLFPSATNRFNQQSQLALSRTAELRVAMERVEDINLRVGEEFAWGEGFGVNPRRTAGERDVFTLEEIDEVKTGLDFMEGLTSTFDEHSVYMGQLSRLAHFFPNHRINLWVKHRYFTQPNGRSVFHNEFFGQLSTLRRNFPNVRVRELTDAHLKPPGLPEMSQPIRPLVNTDPFRATPRLPDISPSQKS